jgi:hypothetical protein
MTMGGEQSVRVRLERIAKLRALQTKFDGFIESESRDTTAKIRDYLTRNVSSGCECGVRDSNLTVEWTTRITPSPAYGDCVWAEWACEEHGSGRGAFVPIHDLI